MDAEERFCLRRDAAAEIPNRFLRIFRDDRSHGIDRRTCGQGFQRPHDRIMLQARNHDMASLAQQALEHHIECHGTVQGKYHMRRILQMKKPGGRLPAAVNLLGGGHPHGVPPSSGIGPVKLQRLPDRLPDT